MQRANDKLCSFNCVSQPLHRSRVNCNLKSISVIAPALFFFKIILTIQVVLWFHRNFRICFLVKYATVILIEISLNQQIALGSTNILIIFPTYEHRIYLHLFISLISFINSLQFSVYRSFTSLYKISMLYVFDAIVHGILLILSF